MATNKEVDVLDTELDLDKVDTKTLMAMFVQAQRQAAAAQEALVESQQKLGEALLESRKPYQSPSDIANKKQAFEERKAEIERRLKQREDTKKYCPHLREDLKSNIQWHEHSNHIIKGVCGLCCSEFDARIPEDRQLLLKDQFAIKNMARAGSHAQRGYIG